MRNLNSFIAKGLRDILDCEAKCRLALAIHYWGIGLDDSELNDGVCIKPVCPFCEEYEGHPVEVITNLEQTKNYKAKDYRCKKTRKSFNVLTGTVFQNIKIDVRKFFELIMCYKHKNYKKDINRVLNKTGLDERTVRKYFDKLEKVEGTKSDIFLEVIIVGFSEFIEKLNEGKEDRGENDIIKLNEFEGENNSEILKSRTIKKKFKNDFPLYMVNFLLKLRELYPNIKRIDLCKILFVLKLRRILIELKEDAVDFNLPMAEKKFGNLIDEINSYFRKESKEWNEIIIFADKWDMGL